MKIITKTSDAHLESFIKLNKSKVIDIITDATHWWDGDYMFYRNKYQRRGFSAKDILTDEEWLEENFEKIAHEYKGVILEKLMNEEEFYKLAEDEGFDY